MLKSMPVDNSLSTVARGASIAMVSMVAALLLQFGTRLVIARFGMQANYGVFSLALVIFTFATALSCLGLQEGAARYIAFFRGKEDKTKIRKIVAATFQLTIVSGIITCVFLYLCAQPIAEKLFHNVDLILPLRIFAIGVPFFTMVYIIPTIFRGFGRIEPQAFFQFLLLNSIFFLLVLINMLFKFPFDYIFYGYLIAIVISFIVLSTYSFNNLPSLGKFNINVFDIKISRAILVFSLPLLGTYILGMSAVNIDTLVLGYLKPVEDVGLYNAAYPLANSLVIPLSALTLIYLPVITSLYSTNSFEELKETYRASAKWINMLTFPVFTVLILFPGAVLNVVVGPDYVLASSALRILSCGFMVHSLLGLSGITLLALGETRYLMWALFIATAVNFLVNILLVPHLGITGAAIASALSLILVNILYYLKLYKICQVKPFKISLLKPIVVSIILAIILGYVINRFIPISIWILPIIFLLYYGIYAAAIVFTKTFEESDMILLLEIEKISRIKIEPLKRVLRKLV